MILNLQKDCHQNNMSFACLQFYKHNCLFLLAGKIYFSYTNKNSIEMPVKDSHSLSFSGTFRPRRLAEALCTI